MNRVVKFRAWSMKKQEWYSFKKFKMKFDDSVGKINELELETKNVVLCQFTGLKDKMGREIYEGDILKGQRYKRGRSKKESHWVYLIFEVRWNVEKCAFEIFYPKMEWSCFLGHCQDAPYTIIGNIYENPDLIISQK